MMTNDRAIELARECGWEVMERTDNVDGGPGIYKVWVPPTPGSHAADYSTYIDTNREPFADALAAICADYMIQDYAWRAGNGFLSCDADTLTRANRVRAVVNRTLEAFREAGK